MSNYQPPSATSSPRFCNMGNFMRLPKAESAKGLDFGIIGIPFDTASSFRTGSRFGPNGMRNISAMIKPNNVSMGVNIMESIKGADLGDVPVIPGNELHKMTAEELGAAVRERVGDSKVFYTFDIDFVDPAYAPGTGTPEVGGFTSYETLEFIRQLKDLNFVGFDVVEVAPPYDHSESTAYMGANIVFEFMSILAYQKKSGKR